MTDLFWKDDLLTIRPLCANDYDAFIAGFRSCTPSRNRFDEGLFDVSFMTPEWYAALLQRRKQEAENDYSYVFHIFRNRDGAAIGECDLSPHRRECFHYGRIGYTIYNPYWGLGYATQSVKGLTDIGFTKLHLHRLEAHVNLDNPASKRVLQKAGYAFECVRKAFILEDGVWTDNEIYYINNASWMPTSEDNI